MKSGPDPAARLPTHTPGDFVLWSDDDLLIVNKPSDLRVIPDGYNPSLPTLVRLLEPMWGRLFVVHRLDKDTSGVIIFARGADSHRSLNQQFAERQVHKTYWALVAGLPGWEAKTIDLPLRINGDRSHRTVVDYKEGKPASTTARVLKRFETWSWVETSPHTGYTHQIRAHLSSIGHPLLGDALYRYPPQWNGPRVDPASLPAFARTALHALEVSFHHPVTAEPLSFKAPLPDDFQVLLKLE
jgi:RluA family pseudouridine synthase